MHSVYLLYWYKIIHTDDIYMYVYINIYVYIYTCVCVCIGEERSDLKSEYYRR